jgi:flagellar biosynthetic protein FlhB
VAADDKTEKPTPKRRSEAREKGQVARSVDLNGAVVLLAGLGVLAFVGPSLFGRMKEVVAVGLARTASPELAGEQAIGDLAAWVGKGLLETVAPVALAAAAAAFLANVAQVRLRLTPKAAKPSLRPLNLLQGSKRIFGPQGLFEGGKAVVKTAIIGTVGFLAVWPAIPHFAALVGLSPSGIVEKLAGVVLGISFRVAVAFLIVGVVDYLWQRRRHEKSLKMSKDEVKREARQHDLAPEVRGAIRRRQREQARRRMMAEVPSADVVVTNPTHFAVALRYDGSAPAPQVVAKGADLVARAIREIAEEHNVPVLRNPPLARALYDEVDLGRQIPEKLYAAVAEVLAFVYRTAGRKRRADRPGASRRRAVARQTAPAADARA